MSERKQPFPKERLFEPMVYLPAQLPVASAVR